MTTLSNQDLEPLSPENLEEKLQKLTEYFLDLIIKGDLKGMKVMYPKLHKIALMLDSGQKELDLEQESQKS